MGKLLIAAVLVVALAGMSSEGRASAQPSCQTHATPTVIHIDPPQSEPWKYVTVYGCNLHGQFHTQCNVLFGGVPGWVTNGVCSDFMYVAIPIAAQAGPVTVEIEGTPTDPFAYDILPLSLSPDDFAAGLITIGVEPGTDAFAIIQQMGGSQSDIVYWFCVDWCWYSIRVDVGTEVSESIQYYSSPDVVWASPFPSGTAGGANVPGLPSGDQPPVQLPGELPATGGTPYPPQSGVDEMAVLFLIGIVGFSSHRWLLRRHPPDSIG